MHISLPSVMNHVFSLDGTRIAYWTSGQGPPLLVVHRVAAGHRRWAPLWPNLKPHFTVYAKDRRGRGESGDTAGYELAREFEDVASVVDAVAQSTTGHLRVTTNSTLSDSSQ